MNTLFLLMAQYDGQAVIPIERVRKDYFSHLSIEKFNRKLSTGSIALPIVRLETSQKTARGVHLQDLALYLDQRRDVAMREANAFRG